MVHVIFDPSTVSLENLFSQEGGSLYSVQLGYGYFRGNIYQRGAGFGNLFQSLWRFIVPLARQAGQSLAPLAKEAVREIGKEGLSTASRVLSNISCRKSLKRKRQALQPRSKKRASKGSRTSSPKPRLGYKVVARLKEGSDFVQVPF